jgi:hypothetical protein
VDNADGQIAAERCEGKDMNQIEHIMALADSFAEYRDHSEYVHARQALRAAIEQALAVQPEQELVEWVDLTPKEVRELFKDGLWIAPSWTIYQEISAKLREKNGETK